jgi:class 3 adenylate cyclase
MGDGLLAYFGYPQAHEDDAERAVRAGLALAAKLSPLLLPTADALQVRVGIATGVVIVGDTIGEEPAQEQVVVGETPNLAARLQSVAAPNTTVIAASTLRLLGDIFVCERLGPLELKGLSESVRAWRVLGGASGGEPLRRHSSDEPYALCRPAECISCTACGSGPRPERVRLLCCVARPASASRA